MLLIKDYCELTEWIWLQNRYVQAFNRNVLGKPSERKRFKLSQITYINKKKIDDHCICGQRHAVARRTQKRSICVWSNVQGLPYLKKNISVKD